MLVSGDAAPCAQLERQFAADIAQSVRIAVQVFNRRTWFHRLLGRIGYALRPRL